MTPLHGVHTAAFRDEAAGAPKGGLKLISCAMLRAPHTPDVVCSLDASGQGAATKTQRAGLPRPDGHGRFASPFLSKSCELRPNNSSCSRAAQIFGSRH